ncbi:MAG: TrkH family potassium uptake protein [Candidatus Ventricola sp.]
MSAQGVIALGFAAIIAAVTLLLMLPASSSAYTWTDPLTALFTATSAVCVTGLVVVDTATHWSLFGRCVILVGIQIGGLGVMTVIALAAMMMRRRIGLRQRTLLVESISTLHIGGIVRLVRRALLGTLLLEGIGALLLAVRFVPMLGPGKGLFYAVFHAVSAFCNAGFDLMGAVSGPFSSLEFFVSDPLVNLTAVFLVLLGGLGFFVWDDLIENRFRFRRLQLHTRVVLAITPVIVLVPACLFFCFEGGASMASMDTKTRALASLFSAVTPRTAGFDTVPTSDLSPAGSLLTLLLMLTGGNPGSTAGGAKTTTMLVLVLLAVSILRREEDIRLFGRRLPDDLMRRACSIVIVYVTLAMAGTLAICAAQPEFALKDVLIEVFSAINTVGMSTGVTRQLGVFAQLILILLMYAGRLGSLTFALLIARRPSPSPLRCPEERILIG